MYILVGTNKNSLCDQENFTELYFLIPVSSNKKVLDSFGIWIDESHLFVDPKSIINLSNNPDSKWLNKFQKMLNSVKKFGWIDNAGRVRMHFEIDH